jgi:hypothetical protein
LAAGGNASTMASSMARWSASTRTTTKPRWPGAVRILARLRSAYAVAAAATTSGPARWHLSRPPCGSCALQEVLGVAGQGRGIEECCGTACQLLREGSSAGPSSQWTSWKQAVVVGTTGHGGRLQARGDGCDDYRWGCGAVRLLHQLPRLAHLKSNGKERDERQGRERDLGPTYMGHITVQSTCHVSIQSGLDPFGPQ